MKRDDSYVSKQKNGVLDIAAFSVLSYNKGGQTAALYVLDCGSFNSCCICLQSCSVGVRKLLWATSSFVADDRR